MIVDALWSLLMLLARTVASLLPTWEPVDFGGLADAVGNFGQGPLWDLLAWLNLYSPLAEALTAGLAVLGLYVGVLIYRAVVDLLAKAHILGWGNR
jgi:hypothetical protein